MTTPANSSDRLARRIMWGLVSELVLGLGIRWVLFLKPDLAKPANWLSLLSQFGLPPERIALILGVDRLLDMARTVLNVAADVVTACIVDERVTPRRSG